MCGSQALPQQLCHFAAGQARKSESLETAAGAVDILAAVGTGWWLGYDVVGPLALWGLQTYAPGTYDAIGNGIGSLIETVARHWAVELSPEDSVLTFNSHVTVGNHVCLMIDSTHPRKKPNFMFYKVKLYIDQEHGMPIRLEGYDWPKRPGAAPELVEEYTYMNLKTNVGLTDRDFDPGNPQYAFGRF